ncbi:MAG TPA: PepSY-associated TM helix domain-containing protein [Candidatus Dormibacteraeota bacterium]|nr:PepSY-associated TM helix domain-containing protein [Candidatus Dormibacteraeota bacterium]
MKRLLLNVHLYVGLVVAIVMAILGSTGALLAFEYDIDHLLNARMDYVQPRAVRLSSEVLGRTVEQQMSGYVLTQIIFPDRAGISVFLRLDSPKTHSSQELYVDPYTGEILGKADGRNTFAKQVHLLHTHLLAGVMGNQLVTWSTAGLLLLAVTGLILWWPRKVTRPQYRTSLHRLNNDLHHSVGFWTSWAMLIFATTGLTIHLAHSPDDELAPQRPAANRLMPRTMTVDQLMAAATKALPDATVTRMRLPLNPAEPVVVQMRLAGDRTPGGRSLVTLDGATGAILMTVSTSTAPFKYNFTKLWTREFHGGDVFGWPSRTLAALCSLALAIQAFTGVLMWFNKKAAVARGRRSLKHATIHVSGNS